MLFVVAGVCRNSRPALAAVAPQDPVAGAAAAAAPHHASGEVQKRDLTQVTKDPSGQQYKEGPPAQAGSN